MLSTLIPALALLTGSPAAADAAQAEPPTSPSPCTHETYEGASYTICAFDRNEPGLRLFLNDASGTPYGDFTTLNARLQEDNDTLIFAMNAGMYHENRSPVGLYIEDGQELARLQTGEGYGNFPLLPNGVFYIQDGEAHVAETSAYQSASPDPDFATQSGPMLVINGELHPRFRADSTSFKRRNGVGVDEKTGKLYFVLSDGWVNFHSFGALFRDHLGCENALFLDGSISRLYDAVTGRNDPGLMMGPIVAIIQPKE